MQYAQYGTYVITLLTTSGVWPFISMARNLRMESSILYPIFLAQLAQLKKKNYEQLLCHARQSKPPIYWRICDIVKDLILT